MEGDDSKAGGGTMEGEGNKPDNETGADKMKGGDGKPSSDVDRKPKAGNQVAIAAR